MKIRFSSDIMEDSGLDSLVSDHRVSRVFASKNYGNNEVEIFFVINCLPINLKNRIRFAKKDKVLYWDVILDYATVKKATEKDKKKILATAIINSFDILDKYKKLNLDKVRIKEDARLHFINAGWLPAVLDTFSPN